MVTVNFSEMTHTHTQEIIIYTQKKGYKCNEAQGHATKKTLRIQTTTSYGQVNTKAVYTAKWKQKTGDPVIESVWFELWGYRRLDTRHWDSECYSSINLASVCWTSFHYFFTSWYHGANIGAMSVSIMHSSLDCVLIRQWLKNWCLKLHFKLQLI